MHSYIHMITYTFLFLNRNRRGKEVNFFITFSCIKKIFLLLPNVLCWGYWYYPLWGYWFCHLFLAREMKSDHITINICLSRSRCFIIYNCFFILTRISNGITLSCTTPTAHYAGWTVKPIGASYLYCAGGNHLKITMSTDRMIALRNKLSISW